jgi:hypothetical protein
LTKEILLSRDEKAGVYLDIRPAFATKAEKKWDRQNAQVILLLLLNKLINLNSNTPKLGSF